MAVWWPSPPSPYPLLLRIGKKPAPVYSGRKFPFSTQLHGASSLNSPSPTQQLCLWHRVGRGGIVRALMGEDRLKGSWASSRAWRTRWPALSSWRWQLKAQQQAAASPAPNRGASQASSTGKTGGWDGNRDYWASLGGGRKGCRVVEASGNVDSNSIQRSASLRGRCLNTSWLPGKRGGALCLRMYASSRRQGGMWGGLLRRAGSGQLCRAHPCPEPLASVREAWAGQGLKMGLKDRSTWEGMQLGGRCQQRLWGPE